MPVSFWLSFAYRQFQARSAESMKPLRYARRTRDGPRPDLRIRSHYYRGARCRCPARCRLGVHPCQRRNAVAPLHANEVATDLPRRKAVTYGSTTTAASTGPATFALRCIALISAPRTTSRTTANRPSNLDRQERDRPRHMYPRPPCQRISSYEVPLVRYNGQRTCSCHSGTHDHPFLGATARIEITCQSQNRHRRDRHKMMRRLASSPPPHAMTSLIISMPKDQTSLSVMKPSRAFRVRYIHRRSFHQLRNVGVALRHQRHGHSNDVPGQSNIIKSC